MALRGDQGDKPGESSHSGHYDDYTASPAANDGLQRILCFCLEQYFMLPNNMILLP